MTAFARPLWCRCGAAARRGIACGAVLGEAEARAEIRGWVWMWMFGVGIQGKRALEPESHEHPQVDAYLFAIALRQLLRDVEWAIKHADEHGDEARAKEMLRALAAFDEAVPSAVDVRDVLVHFDEYERGTGRLQKRREKVGKRAPQLNIFTESDETTYWLHLLDNGHRLDVNVALDAAHELAKRVLDALS